MFARIRFRQRIRIPLPQRLQIVPPRPPLFFFHRRPLSSSSSSANVVVPAGSSPAAELESASHSPPPPPDWVPANCPGCGAPSQRVDDSLPGFYPEQMSRRQRFGGDLKIKRREKHIEASVFRDALLRVRMEAEAGIAPSSLLGELGEAATTPLPSPPPPPPPNVCNRCHTLVHHHRGPELPAYPTLDTLATLLVNSKHRLNHIYHLVDAADLPLSLVPSLRRFLASKLPWDVARGLTVSYVVTRADLLMPSEKAVSSLMSWIKRTIKEALPEGEKVEGREGRIHVISVRNGWGVGAVKEEIQRRAGGVWILGAVNVGKSRFVREMWPETGEARPVSVAEAAEFGILPAERSRDTDGGGGERARLKPLPSSPPTVSDVPGTTAAPIKIAYKVLGRSGRVGELIDLPGLQRWVGYGNQGLLKYVRDEKKPMVIMKHMVKHKQYTIKPGQSMTLGGLIMITPKTTGAGAVVVLATPFTTLPVHIFANEKSLKWLAHSNPAAAPPELFYKPVPVHTPTTPTPTPTPTPTSPPADQSKPERSTENHTKPLTTASDLPKAEPQQPQQPPSSPQPSKPTEEFIPPSIPPHFSSAGVFPVSSDVTLQRNPRVFGSQLEGLKYMCLATDVVLEGVGWVELNVQMSKRNKAGDKVDVEVFTPAGRGVAQRDPPMGAHMLRTELNRENHPRGPRKRRPAKGEKKSRKRAARLYTSKGD